jgi:hypothetical protein
MFRSPFAPPKSFATLPRAREAARKSFATPGKVVVVIANRTAVKRSILAGAWIASARGLAMTDVKCNSCFITRAL